MHRLAALALISACSSTSSQPIELGEPPSEHYEPTVATKAYGGWDIDLDPVLATVRQMRGEGIPWVSGTSDLEATVRVEFELMDPAKAI